MADLITGFNTSVQNTEVVDSEATSQFLSFYLANKLYAVEILEVEEIIEPSEITEIPLAPDYIRGVINLRGDVVPVFDLTAHMGHGRRDINKRSCIVLVQIQTETSGKQTLGLLVDSVNEIVEIDSNKILPPPKMGSTVNTNFIKSMGRVENSFIILLNVDTLLSTELLEEINSLSQLHKTEKPVEE